MIFLHRFNYFGNFTPEVEAIVEKHIRSILKERLPTDDRGLFPARSICGYPLVIHFRRMNYKEWLFNVFFGDAADCINRAILAKVEELVDLKIAHDKAKETE